MRKPECYGKNPDCAFGMEGFDCKLYLDCYHATVLNVAIRNVQKAKERERAFNERHGLLV